MALVIGWTVIILSLAYILTLWALKPRRINDRLKRGAFIMSLLMGIMAIAIWTITHPHLS